MENKYRLLNLSTDATLKHAKDAYYTLIKKYTPEDNPEKFIEINNAYNEVKQDISSRTDSKEFLSILNLIIERDCEKNVISLLKNYIQSVDSENYVLKNDQVIDGIMYLKRNSHVIESIFITILFKNKFKDLGLIGLSNAYEKLENKLVNTILRS